MNGTLTGLAQPVPDTSRGRLNEGSFGGDGGLRRVLELVSAAMRD